MEYKYQWNTKISMEYKDINGNQRYQAVLTNVITVIITRLHCFVCLKNIESLFCGYYKH